MTKFEKAYDALFGMEGTYSNDSGDSGGETFCGIARNYNKTWAGWKIIDDYKRSYGSISSSVQKKLLNNQELMNLVYSFYKTKYWDVYDCDTLPYSLALEIFEQSVNLGASRCSRNLQQTLNAMNYRGEPYGYGKDLAVDGKWGPASRSRLKQMIDAGYAKQVQFGINCLQGAFYIDSSLSNPSKRKFLKGWLGQRTEAIYSSN